MNVFGALLFVVALLLSIVLHEAGHMVCARWSGGKVTEFFVGFGAKLWSFRRGETEYGIKAIPAGGYVKIVGMTDLDEIEPGDEDRALKDKPAWKRLITLAAGSITHFLIALILLFLIPVAFGIQKADPPARIGGVAACMTAEGTQSATCGPGTRTSPAAAAGLKPGDLITSVGGVRVDGYQALVKALRALPPGRPAVIGYQDAGGGHTATVSPLHSDALVDANGKTVSGSVVGLTGAAATERLNPLAAAGYSGSQFWDSLKATFQGLGSIPASVPKLFSSTIHHTQRSADTPVSVVGMTELSGSIIGAAGFAGFFGFIAMINVFIGVFNLLPLLPLDGGHIAVLLYEQARKGVFRLLKRPAPGRVDLNKLMPVAYAFLLVFVSLALLLIAADITNPLHLPS